MEVQVKVNLMNEATEDEATLTIKKADTDQIEARATAAGKDPGSFMADCASDIADTGIVATAKGYLCDTLKDVYLYKKEEVELEAE